MNSKTTPFQQAQQDVRDGKLKAPNVDYEGKPVPYFRYQLAVHKHHLSIMAAGMTFKNVKLKDLKQYYGLKGRTAKDCLPQFIKIMEEYEKEIIRSN